MKRKEKEIDVSRLCVSIERSRLVLQRYREENLSMVREYAGNHWSDAGTPYKVPINLLSLYVQVVSRNLVAKNPRVMLTVPDKGLKPTVSAMETWANQKIEDMRAQSVLQRLVIDSLFSIGVAKVALATPADSASLAWNLRAGQPFLSAVSLDDFVYDVRANDFDEVSYIGHRYRVPLDVVKDSKIYNKSRKQLSPSYNYQYNRQGDERLSALGKGIYANNIEDFEDYVDLWEIYLPRHRAVITLADDYMSGAYELARNGGDVEPLRVQPWVGRDTGPYQILSMGIIPGNAMPKSPIQDLFELHLECNTAMRKVCRMCARIKENTFVSSGAMEDAARLQKAIDGEIIPVNRPQDLKNQVTGGSAMQLVFGMATQFKAIFNEMAGNLALLSGANPQSKTAAQDKMLNENAHGGVADMQDRTTQFVSEVMKNLLWYFKHDPYAVQESSYSLPGMPEMSIQRRVGPQDRKQIPFERMNIRVDPYSMQFDTPQTRMAHLDQTITTVLLPLMPLLQQQGIAIDINAYLQKKAKYGNMPDLPDIVTIQEPPQQDVSGPGDPGSVKPAETTRNYVRESMPGRTQKGNDLNMANQMMGIKGGGNPNEHQTNGVMQQ